MNFADSVEYLYALGNEVLAMKLGLENPRKLLQALNNPHKKYQKVQVAGTNGKGSTCAFLDAICRAAHIKTGLYTSPHLISIRERIKINGELISEDEFARLATQVREITENQMLRATFFEQMTAIALLAFAEHNVELAILETGLGGRLDATTAADAEIVAITPIDYDHQQYLGNSLGEIAGEKAAIINSSDQKVVVSKQMIQAEKVIIERCRGYGIKPLRTDFELGNKKLSLAGNHQIENAKVAHRLAEILKISQENIDIGLRTATHKGRLEYYKGILFDGAHNIAGARALKEYIEEFINRPLTLVFGAMMDKQIFEITKILFPLADKIILTKPDNPRSAAPQEIAKLIEKEVYLTENVAEALRLAERFSENLTCVTGSLYLVGEAQMILSAE